MLGHEHSGRLRPHTHTTYAALTFMLLLVGVLLVGLSWAAEAAPPAVNPQSGSIGLSGTVPGKPPSSAATILTPSDGTHTSTIPLTVSGTCPAGDFVDIEKNNVFAGAAECGDNGTFSVQVDLFSGINTLVARVADALGQFGPDSAGVTAYYDAPTPANGASTVQQLFLTTATTILGGNPGQGFARSVTINGGVGPYAVSWDFGDGATSLASASTTGIVSSNHSYTRPGIYNVIVRVTDSTGSTAYLQVLSVVNGPVAAYGASGASGVGAITGGLVGAWPLYSIAVLMVGVFWLGELREGRKLRKLRELQERSLV